MVKINGYDIKAQWGMVPIYGGLYDAVLKGADVKDRQSDDFADEDGLEVLTTPTRLKAKEYSISLMCDTIAQYKTFVSYMKSNPFFTLLVDIDGITRNMEYRGIGDFNYYRDYASFTIKVRELVPPY